MTLSGWGRLSKQKDGISILGRGNIVLAHLDDASTAIVFGMGRSYGDQALNPDGKLYRSNYLDRYIAFDETTGVLSCEAGVTLGNIQRDFWTRGWMLPVTPGTQFVTVGGAIANDVHGKNHHTAGCFGRHVLDIHLFRTDGSQLVCSPAENNEWFDATIGGLGLTGIITRATIQLRPVNSCWLDTDTISYNSLEEFFSLSEESEANWEYAVSWIDCSRNARHRGIFIRANHAAEEGHTSNAGNVVVRVPFTPPVSPVNRYTLSAFNSLYFMRQVRRQGESRDHYASYYYPLDAVRDWNRLYGRRGFHQYQLVVPSKDGKTVIAALLDTIASSGMGSFLSVLKTFGHKESPGLLSFPMPGITLALDFPDRGAKLESLFSRLDSIVREAGGRLYLAKDARMSAEMFEAGYPNLNTFLKYRDVGLSSSLSQRLLGI